MMYTPPNFKSEKASRSQVEHLQNQPQLLIGLKKRNKNVQQECIGTDLKHIWVASGIVL